MSDVSESPRRPNWLLVGLADDETLTDPEIERHWPVTSRTRQEWRHAVEDPLPFLSLGGVISYIVGPARDWARRRIHHLNRRRRS